MRNKAIPGINNKFIVVTALISSLLIKSCTSYAIENSSAHKRSDFPKISYHLTADTTENCLHVSLHIDSPGKEAIDAAIPAWTPGYYQILNYQANIDHVTAKSDSNPALLTHPSSRIWEVASTSAERNSIDISYDVHFTEEGHGFFSSILKAEEKEGYINGASALMYIVGLKNERTSLTLTIPEEWKIATPLTSTSALNSDGSETSSQSFSAENYDELIDSPIQFGKFDETIFKTDGILFRCILIGNHQANKKKLVNNLTKIAHTELQQFGFAPFKNYIFYLHCGGAGFYGGLEHRSSTVIHLSGPIKDGNDDELLSVAAHELFHAWNVKKLKPLGLGPFDYTQKVRSSSLWWAEGVTDYYAELTLVRAGLRTKSWFLNEFAARIADFDSDPARTRVSLEEASLKAWEGHSEGFGGMSYYLKGSLAALYFDLRIRALTNGNRGLEDAFLVLETQYGSSDSGYPETALLDALNITAGASLTDEYDAIINKTVDIDWKRCFVPAGIILSRERSNVFGVELEDTSSVSPVVHHVEQGFPGEIMGMKAGDKILSVNERQALSSQLPEIMSHLAEDSPVRVRVERGGVSIKLEGRIASQYSHAKLSLLPENQLSTTAASILASLFTRRPDHPVKLLESITSTDENINPK